MIKNIWKHRLKMVWRIGSFLFMLALRFYLFTMFFAFLNGKEIYSFIPWVIGIFAITDYIISLQPRLNLINANIRKELNQTRQALAQYEEINRKADGDDR